MLGRVSFVRSGSESINSKPQNTEYSPVTTNKSPRRVGDVAPAASIIARSPRYCRTTTGAPGAPCTLLTTDPRYVPPRSQIVSPGAVRAPPAPPTPLPRAPRPAPRPSPAPHPHGVSYWRPPPAPPPPP